MHEAVRKMDSQEPTYLGTLFPAYMQTHSVDHSQQSPEMTSQTDSFTVPLLDKFNTTLINLIFNIVTLINALVHCCLLISARLSTRNGGWLTKFVAGVVQATLTQKTVQALELLKPTPHPRSLLDLDIDELENVLKATTPIPKFNPPRPSISFNAERLCYIGRSFPHSIHTLADSSLSHSSLNLQI